MLQIIIMSRSKYALIGNHTGTSLIIAQGVISARANLTYLPVTRHLKVGFGDRRFLRVAVEVPLGPVGRKT